MDDLLEQQQHEYNQIMNIKKFGLIMNREQPFHSI